jgi:hypothetical protein
MRFLFVKTAAVSLLMLGTAAAQVGGVTGGIGTGSTFNSTGLPSLFAGTGARAPVGGTGIPLGATGLATGGLSPLPSTTAIPGLAPVTPMSMPAIGSSIPGLAGPSGSGSAFTGFGPGGMQPLPGSPGNGPVR